jgi:anti-sigma factor RsiW
MSQHPDLEDRLSRLLGPGTPEVSCEQCFEQIDAYVDHQLADSVVDADAAFPGMRAHLAGCPACAEEHDALVQLVQARTGG